MARKDSRTKERLFVCVCVHFNIKDVSMNLAIINEGKTKIKYKKREPGGLRSTGSHKVGHD